MDFSLEDPWPPFQTNSSRYVTVDYGFPGSTKYDHSKDEWSFVVSTREEASINSADLCLPLPLEALQLKKDEKSSSNSPRETFRQLYLSFIQSNHDLYVPAFVIKECLEVDSSIEQEIYKVVQTRDPLTFSAHFRKFVYGKDSQLCIRTSGQTLIERAVDTNLEPIIKILTSKSYIVVQSLQHIIVFDWDLKEIAKIKHTKDIAWKWCDAFEDQNTLWIYMIDLEAKVWSFDLETQQHEMVSNISIDKPRKVLFGSSRFQIFVLNKTSCLDLLGGSLFKCSEFQEIIDAVVVPDIDSIFILTSSELLWFNIKYGLLHPKLGISHHRESQALYLTIVQQKSRNGVIKICTASKNNQLVQLHAFDYENDKVTEVGKILEFPIEKALPDNQGYLSTHIVQDEDSNKKFLWAVATLDGFIFSGFELREKLSNSLIPTDNSVSRATNLQIAPSDSVYISEKDSESEDSEDLPKYALRDWTDTNASIKSMSATSILKRLKKSFPHTKDKKIEEACGLLVSEAISIESNWIDNLIEKQKVFETPLVKEILSKANIQPREDENAAKPQEVGLDDLKFRNTQVLPSVVQVSQLLPSSTASTKADSIALTQPQSGQFGSRKPAKKRKQGF